MVPPSVRPRGHSGSFGVPERVLRAMLHPHMVDRLAALRQRVNPAAPLTPDVTEGVGPRPAAAQEAREEPRGFEAYRERLASTSQWLEALLLDPIEPGQLGASVASAVAARPGGSVSSSSGSDPAPMSDQDPDQGGVADPQSGAPARVALPSYLLAMAPPPQHLRSHFM